MSTGTAALLVMAGWLITAAVFNVRAAWVLIVAGTLLAAVVVSSTPAKAEPVTGPDVTGPDPAMICQQLVLGFTPDQVVGQLHSGDPRFNTYTAPQTVWNAIIEQCS